MDNLSLSTFQSALTILALGISVFSFFGFLRVWQRLKSWDNVMQHLGDGVQGESLERRLDRLFLKIDQVSFNFNQLGQIQQEMRDRMRYGVQKKATLRFNPFEDTGGDQSFAVAFLDENDDGVVLSSLHARDSTRVYAKPIERGKSRYQLTDEEKQVLINAMGKKTI